MQIEAVDSAAALLERLLLAFIFLVSGWGKITGYDVMVAYMGSAGPSGLLLPLVITELAGGLLVAIGWKTKLAAIALGGFTVLAALFFHTAFSDQNQMILHEKYGDGRRVSRLVRAWARARARVH